MSCDGPGRPAGRGRFAAAADPTVNLLDALDAELAARGVGSRALATVPHRPGEGDVRLASRSPQLDAAQLRARPGELHVRFEDAQLAALGAELEAGGPDPLTTRTLGEGERWIVSFADPNTSKALHVGHLRNLALGHGLASLAQAAGIDVTRQNRAGDFGRNMGEALAGWLAHGGGRTPEASGLKGDHLVGACYARYVRGVAASGERAPDDGEAAALDPALSRETDVRYDAADKLLARWRAGDPEVAALFERVRGWVLDGHDATLARLGIAMDRTLLESDFVDDVDRLAQEAVTRGVVTRQPSGAVVYETGEERYPRLLLLRHDGFPTQHLRHIAAWWATRPLFLGGTSIVVVGDEWGPLGRYCERILSRLAPEGEDDGERERHPTCTLTHAMVLAGGGRVSSTGGTAPLVDELLDGLAGAPPVAALCRRHRRCDPDAIAAAVALGFFLGQPAGKRVTLAPQALLASARSIGWALAQAWARAWDARWDGRPDPDPDEQAYRFALVASQRHRRLLAKSLDELDPLALVRFHFHLARWFSALEHPSARVARLMRAVLGSGMEAFGLAPRADTALEPQAAPLAQ
jgi:arginyl-tRNA synthetase